MVEQIKTTNPNYEKFATVKLKALKETQRSIPPGVMLVQYAPLGEQLYVFLVSKENVKIVIASGQAGRALEEDQDATKTDYERRIRAPSTRISSALYDSLIARLRRTWNR